MKTKSKTKKKYLTRRQAWLFLAKKFDSKRNNPFNATGLCRATYLLAYREHIEWDVRDEMKNQIEKYGHTVLGWEKGYFWPGENGFPSRSDRPRRAALCRRFAREKV